MAYAEYLRGLLAPMGVYELSGESFSGAELCAAGEALDGADSEIALLEREVFVMSAEDFGLESWEVLFASRPAAKTVNSRRRAIAALLRISGDSFTQEALNSCLAGCGMPAVVEETGEPGMVVVSFPGIMGQPARFPEIKKIIEEILPAHLGIEYYFEYFTWEYLEAHLLSWEQLEAECPSWAELEVYSAYKDEESF